MITFAVAAVFFVAGVTTFTRFTDRGIEIQHPFSFRSTFYDYTRVRSIEHRATFPRQTETRSSALTS